MGSAKLLIIAALMLVSMVSIVSAVPVTIDQVKVNGDEVGPSGTEIRSLDRDNEFDIKVTIDVSADADDVQIEVLMRGYDHDDLIEDITDAFDITEGVTYVKTLHIELPKRMESEDQYWLRVLVTDRNSELVQENYVIYVEGSKHDVEIRDVIFSPDNEVKAGRALLATVRLKNYGSKDEDSIKVTASMPDLGISASDYIDTLDAGDSVTSEELYLRIPMCVKGGLYDVIITAEFDDGDEEDSMTDSIRVVEDETCGEGGATQDKTEEKTFVTAPGSQDVNKGTTGAVYPIMVTNAGAQSKTYTFKVSGVDSFGTYRIDPSALMVVGAGKTETVYVYITPFDEAPVGESAFFVEVSSGTDKKLLPLTANVMGDDVTTSSGSLDTVKRVLQIGVVVLIVLLVIFGLIIGFNKLKGSNDSGDDDSTGQTYY